eukprot:scaffold1454_cov342-Pavlova_lutheri.AAC.12
MQQCRFVFVWQSWCCGWALPFNPTTVLRSLYFLLTEEYGADHTLQFFSPCNMIVHCWVCDFFLARVRFEGKGWRRLVHAPMFRFLPILTDSHLRLCSTCPPVLSADLVPSVRLRLASTPVSRSSNPSLRPPAPPRLDVRPFQPLLVPYFAIFLLVGLVEARVRRVEATAPQRGGRVRRPFPEGHEPPPRLTTDVNSVNPRGRAKGGGDRGRALA